MTTFPPILAVRKTIIFTIKFDIGKKSEAVCYFLADENRK